MTRSVMGVAFAGGCALALAALPSAHAQYYRPYAQPQPGPYLGITVETNGPQASRGDYGDWSARRNVAESAQYDRLLQTSPGFRQARMRRECGPIGNPPLRDQCLASFEQYEPMVGSSLPPRDWRQPGTLGY